MSTKTTSKNKKIRMAINGFGRIGRAALKIALEKPNIEIVAVNDLSTALMLAQLLKYDTAYGVYPREVTVEKDGKVYDLDDFRGDKDFFLDKGTQESLIIDGKHKIAVLSEKNPKDLPWKKLNIDVVLECTGRFRHDNAAYTHIDAGAKKVVLSANAKGDKNTITPYVLGANIDEYDGVAPVVSNASCTTNCVSPVVSIIHKVFGVKKAMLTTIHGVTAEQNIVDKTPPPMHPDMRRARAGAWNMIPTTTGAAKAATKCIIDLENKFDGLAIRVPIIAGSLSAITFVLSKKTSAEEINSAFIAASKDAYYKDVVDVTYEPIVSSDIIGTTYSAIIDLTMTTVVDGDLAKVLAWYDNEWGYSNRLVELALEISQ